MFRVMHQRWALVVVACIAIGCAQEEGEATEKAATPNAAPNAASPAPVEEANVKAVEAPALAEYRVIAGESLEARPVAAWVRSEKDGFEISTSPDGRARILIAPFKNGDTLAARRDAGFGMLGATDVRTGEERNIRVGVGQLEAQASDGTCKLPAGEAGFQYAIIQSSNGRKTFVMYVFDKDVPTATRDAGMSMIASLRMASAR